MFLLFIQSTHVSYTTEMNQFLDELEVVVSRISVAANNGLIMVEQSLFDIESIVQDVVYLYDLLPTHKAESLVQSLCDLHMWLSTKVDRVQRGRPRIGVSESQLSMLLSFQFPLKDIARLLQVSVSTV